MLGNHHLYIISQGHLLGTQKFTLNYFYSFYISLFLQSKIEKNIESYNHKTSLNNRELGLGTERLHKFISLKKQARQRSGNE